MLSKSSFDVFSIIDIYIAQIAYNIQKKWKSNRNFIENKNTLETLIAFNVMPDGAIKDIWIDKKSGNEYFDETAYEVILTSSSARPHPKEISMPYMTIGLRFTPQGIK